MASRMKLPMSPHGRDRSVQRRRQEEGAQPWLIVPTHLENGIAMLGILESICDLCIVFLKCEPSLGHLTVGQPRNPFVPQHLRESHRLDVSVSVVQAFPMGLFCEKTDWKFTTIQKIFVNSLKSLSSLAISTSAAQLIVEYMTFYLGREGLDALRKDL